MLLEDVDRCVIKGEVVGKQGHGENAKWVLRERDGEGEIFFVVVALSRPSPVIVTVMRNRDDSGD